ncbi:S-adenosyl-L-methionine-dependent methyltransferase [Rhizodiscina lignyota]|uniref:DNA (cytosine-5-)-methyltransferase n=1 Tax=Rhizodiscina lignyota TaxID=1504668 RepID=A0A9P4IDN1_9PEZI|nr:S-adenosyl-L-methionine-dependent methyltransferase [Rhizodiscina lignyota]
MGKFLESFGSDISKSKDFTARTPTNETLHAGRRWDGTLILDEEDRDELELSPFTLDELERIDLTNDDDDNDDDTADELIVTHVQTNTAAQPRRVLTPQRCTRSIARPSIPRRNQPIEHPLNELDHFELSQQTTLKQGHTYELIDEYGDVGQFIYVRHIIFDHRTAEVLVRGLILNRNSRLKNMLDKRLNEVCISAEEDRDDPRSIFEQAMVDVPVAAIGRERELVYSRRLFPEDSFRSYIDIDPSIPKEDIRHHIFNYERLTCRRVYIKSFPTALGRVKGVTRREIEEEIRILSENAIDELASKLEPKPESESNNAYQDTPTRRLSTRKRFERSPSLEILEESPSKKTRQHMHIPANSQKQHRYTYGSAFCGAGGDSCGAALAGADVAAGFDNSEDRCSCWSENNPRGRILNKEAWEAWLGYLDILHISCPCKFWSLLHTRPGKNDEANEASLYSVRALIERAAYRIVTLEQVRGLIVKHRPVFNRLINQIVEAGPGYSVRWKLMDFREFGVMANRERLIIIASRRNEPLPPFPKPTHGDAAPRHGLKPFETIWSALSPLRNAPFASHNDPQNPNHCSIFNVDKLREGYNPKGDRRMPCITTSGGDGNVHWSGSRSFTNRELACLNGVPVTFKFTSSKLGVVRQQIGDMVPPLAWKAVIGSVIKTLKAFDAREIDSDGNKTAIAPGQALSTTTTATSTAPTLMRRMRQLSVSVASSRTISADPPSDVDRKGKKPAETTTDMNTTDKRRETIDLTGDDDEWNDEYII